MVIGLTGGIGSGKTTVLNMFSAIGIPTYVTDAKAKQLMNTDEYLIKGIKQLLGERAYNENGLDRVYIADKVFKNKVLLERLNQLVHPRVHEDFKQFYKSQSNADYVIYESALLLQKQNNICDKVIVITADIETRISRVMRRDIYLMRDDVEKRIHNQFTQEQLLGFADFQIENNVDLITLKGKVNEMHKMLTQ